MSKQVLQKTWEGYALPSDVAETKRERKWDQRDGFINCALMQDHARCLVRGKGVFGSDEPTRYRVTVIVEEV